MSQSVMRKGKSSANLDDAEDSQVTLDLTERTKFYDEQKLLTPPASQVETGPTEFPQVEDAVEEVLAPVQDAQDRTEDDADVERTFPSVSSMSLEDDKTVYELVREYSIETKNATVRKLIS